MSLDKDTTTTTENVSSVDPKTRAFMEKWRADATRVAGLAEGAYRNLGPSRDQMFASNVARGLTNRFGFASQPFSREALSGYLNPYTDEVIGGVRGDFDYQRDYARNAAADQATRAGAFGGDRSAILEAQALSDINRNEIGTTAGLRSAGYTDAANRFAADQRFAGQLGMAGLNGLFQSADMQRMMAQARAAGLASIPGITTPGLTPTTQTNTTTEHYSTSPWQTIAGLAGTVGSFLVPGAGPAMSLLSGVGGSLLSPGSPLGGTGGYTYRGTGHPFGSPFGGGTGGYTYGGTGHPMPGGPNPFGL